jgi:hypothetical protein
MRLPVLPVLLAVLALGAASPVLAQTPATPVASKGVVVADTRTWLIGLGGSVAEPAAENGAQVLTVADQPLPWTLTFYNCTGASLCDDAQFSAVFSGPITVEQINEWNRGNRYLKAFFVPGTTPDAAGAIAQYDVVLTSTGTEQLQEPTVIWLQMLRQFAQSLAQAAGSAPAAQ